MPDFIKLDLQLFGGEGGGSAGGDGGGAAAAGADGSATGVEGPAAGDSSIIPNRGRGRRANPFRAPQGETQEAAAEQAPEQRRSFDDLIRGEYKDDFGRAVQGIVQERLKNSKKGDETLARLAPMLNALAQRYNVAEGDYDQLSAAIMDDDSIYEDEAIERGMSVETLKSIKNLERENAAMREREQQSMKDMQMRAHFDRLGQQAEAARQFYPNLDLATELKNPQFLRLTSPGVNVDVKTAYEVVHADEMRGAMMQYAAQRRASDMSKAIQSGSRRPSETGLSRNAQAATQITPDINNKSWREEVKRRARAGERITL